MVEKKLFLLDAYALIYRAYYALIRAPRITSKGFNTSAIFGFCNTLDEILRKEKPTHIAVCFDPPHGRTFRHEIFEDYKAQREAQPEDITLSVPVIKEIIEAYNIPIFEVPGYEADDVIGTLSRLAEKEGFTTYMMTPDKDYGQLVTDHVLMYRPSLKGQGFEVRGVKEVCEKYDIPSPDRVIDLLALEGDSIDNIPGCPGVGPKTAAKLIKEYGTVENLIANDTGIKGALGERVRANEKQIELSKDLATIRTDIPLTVNFDELRRGPENVDALKEIYARLEFKSFLARLGGGMSAGQENAEKAAKKVTPVADKTDSRPSQMSLFDFIDDDSSAQTGGDQNDVKIDYAELTGEAAIRTFIGEALGHEIVGLAVYAVGPEAMTAVLKGVAVATSPGYARLISIPAEPDAALKVIGLLAPLFSAEKTLVSSHDIKRDMVILRRFGVEISSKVFDTSLAHYILQPEMRHRLSDLAMTILNVATADYAEDSRKAFGAVPAGEEVSRICQQADMVMRLTAPLKELLKANGGEDLVYNLELPLAGVLADMEWTGVRIDSGELNKLSVELTRRLKDIEEEAYDLAGAKFNIGSPSQVGEILFGQLKLDLKAKRTKTGAYSTTEEILEKHRSSHPIVDLILKARSLKKLLATYVNALPEMVNPLTGKIHTTFNQTVTATGRISSANPNLQNIPIRTDDGREVRRAFIADPGCLLLSADYSQIELRLLANLSDDPELTEAFNSGLDIHRATAAKIYHVPYEEVTETQRRNAKTANFGTVYGISAFGLSERLGIPRAEAKELIEGYFNTYPHIRQFIDDSIEKARERGYVETYIGRRRYLPDINSRNATVRNFAERNAVNAPLQGSAADIIKKAMIEIHNELNRRNMKSKMILQVHDELIFNVYPDELNELNELVTKLMSGVFSGNVPLEVSAGTGTNWLEAH